MFKYIKRQTSRRRSSHDTEANNVDDNDVVDCAAAAQKRHSLRSTTSFCDEVFMEEEELQTEATATATSDAISLGNNSLLNVGAAADEDIFKYSSRLSMTLTAIVREPDCLSYFLQYLETQNALPLIKFYLDIENFRRAALTQLQQEQERPHDATSNVAAATDSQLESPIVSAAVEDEENDVPEIKTLCDLSMRKPLTDDEKSRIYAETNKQIHNKPAGAAPTCSPTACSEVQPISAASINDAIAIYQKYLIVNAPLLLELPIVILAHISLLLCGKASDKSPHQPIPASCFDEARDHVLQKLEREHLQGFLQSSYYCKYCVELIEGNASSLNIYDVLYDELALFYLTEYLEQQQERECLEFWITAINFRKSYDDQRAAQSDAMIIYERYFSLQSECRLWMSQKLRLRVEQAICAPGQLAQAFDLALLVTAKYLERKHFANFLKSNIFDNYVNELKAKTCVYTPPDSTDSSSMQHKLSLRRAPKLSSQQRHRKTMSMSDCTHISQHNTLLAGLDNGHKPVKSPSTTTTTAAANMNIDARQLTNPQLLWQRPVSALKFGHVNSLGRYERDFEAVDAVSAQKAPAWSLSVKNAMRKLVNLPEDNVQEEIAWQVAEMIVKDVTSVTLHGKH